MNPTPPAMSEHPTIIIERILALAEKCRMCGGSGQANDGEGLLDQPCEECKGLRDILNDIVSATQPPPQPVAEESVTAMLERARQTFRWLYERHGATSAKYRADEIDELLSTLRPSPVATGDVTTYEVVEQAPVAEKHEGQQ